MMTPVHIDITVIRVRLQLTFYGSHEFSVNRISRRRLVTQATTGVPPLGCSARFRHAAQVSWSRRHLLPRAGRFLLQNVK